MKTKTPVRYAVVGLGHFAQVAILPAFRRLKNSKLMALVSKTDEKLELLQKRYQVPQIHTYEDYDSLIHSGDIDAVYVALPNNMHRDFAVAALNAGVHVLCEKPMAVEVEDCHAMNQASRNSGAQLMVAYRLHFEKANLSAVEMVRRGKIGDARIFNSVFSMQVKQGIRTDGDKGGGPLYDIGIYCINAARYIFQAEPKEVFAFFSTDSHDPRFQEVEAQVCAVMRFPGDRLAQFAVSFQGAEVSKYEIIGTRGTLNVDPAFDFAGELQSELTVEGKTTKYRYRKRDQIAAEILYFSDCILSGKSAEPSGIEGLLDVTIMKALMQSAREGRSIRLGAAIDKTRPTLTQEIYVPPHREPKLVKVHEPH